MLPPRLLALSLLFAFAVPAFAQAQEVDLRRKVSVRGQSSTLVANDAARVSLGVSATRPAAGAALRAASLQMQRVIGAARAAGVAAADIRTEDTSVSQLVTRLKGGRTHNRGYRAVQSVVVVVRDVASTGSVVQRAVGAGATRVSGPQFFVSDASRSYRDALALAFDDAKAAAQVLAERAGVRLGAVLSIEEATGNESGPQSAAGPGGSAPGVRTVPAPPSQPGRSRLDASVVVVFELVG
jgi:uncharacterized protein YggE